MLNVIYAKCHLCCVSLRARLHYGNNSSKLMRFKEKNVFCFKINPTLERFLP
jgi:hypothetical protein